MPEDEITVDDEPASTGGAQPAKGAVGVSGLSRLQQATARRNAESKATVPHLQLVAAIDARPAFQTAASTGTDVLDVAIGACAEALREFPRLNAAYRDGAAEDHERINIAIAMAAQETTVAPTIFDADTLAPAQIAERRAELSRRAEDGAITSPELAGATFTVHPVPAGVTSISPIVTPGQSAAIAIGPAEPAALVDAGGQLVAGRRLTLALACDARLLTAAEAGAFLARVRALLESTDR